MLPSLRFFRNDPCPYFKAGLCDRAHCPFRHCASARTNIFEVDDEDVPQTSKMKVPSPSKPPDAKVVVSERAEKLPGVATAKTPVIPDFGIEHTGEVKGMKSESPDSSNQNLKEAEIEAKKEADAKAERKRLEEEYERMLLGDDDDDDVSDIDPEVAEQFLLPEDTDEDPEELFEACYTEWLRSKQEPKLKTPEKERSDEETAKSSKSRRTDETASGSRSPKKRVAHPNAKDYISSNSSQSSSPASKMIKLTPSQTLQNRYEQVRQLSSVSEASYNDEEVSNCRFTTEPHIGLITLSFKKSIINENDDRLKSKDNTSRHNQTISQTIEKGATRKAHSPIKAPGSYMKQSQKPAIPKHSIAGSKIPLITRQHTLDQLFKACESVYRNHGEASKRAIAEEQMLSTRHKNKQVYVGASANCLKRLRDEAAKVQRPAVTSGNGDPGPSSSAPARKVSFASHPQSHQQNLAAGPGRDNWSILTKGTPDLLAKTALYKALTKYMLTPEQLTDNGYPRTHPSGHRGRVTTKNRKNKQPFNGNASSRVCDRCGKEFKVGLDGSPVSKELCIYHHGRNYQRRVNGSYEGRYSCCDADPSSQGCAVGNVHVSTHPSDEIYGFVAAVQDVGPDSTMGSEPWDIVALDCEMVYTTYGNELARATFVSADKTVLYDELVKPIHPIIDYNTRFSGITAEMMAGVTTSLTDVQATMLSRIRPNSILIGHSLESDLMALKVKHDTVVDTSVLFPHRYGPPYKRALRTLASECLGKIIQTGEAGHNSEEDALTALELVLWKVQGDKLMEGSESSKRFKKY